MTYSGVPTPFQGNACTPLTRFTAHHQKSHRRQGTILGGGVIAGKSMFYFTKKAYA